MYMFSCLVEAGRLVKLDTKRSMSTKDSSLIPSFLAIDGDFLPFEDQEIDFAVDRRRGVLSNAGKSVAVCITRPRFDKWAFSMTLLVAEHEVTVEKVKQLVERAGTAVGLGDFRPAKRGPFGRFSITKWETIA